MYGRRTTRRWLAVALTGTCLAALGGPAASATSQDGFNPVLEVRPATSAARATTNLRLDVFQADHEDQIQHAAVTLPAAFGLDTCTGTQGTTIGAIAVVVYVNPRPSTITLSGEVLDDNAACNLNDQVVKMQLHVPGFEQPVTARAHILSDANGHHLDLDLTSVWSNEWVQATDARLKQLYVELAGQVPGHRVVTNPSTASSTAYALTYSLSSGTKVPDCGVTCSIPLPITEQPPTRAVAAAPADGAAVATPASIDFAWWPASDANGDDVTYELQIDGNEIVVATGATHKVQALEAGDHTWRVDTIDSTGLTTTGTQQHLLVIDRARAMTFESLNGDTLLVTADPGSDNDGFVYFFGGQQFGAWAPGLTTPGGTINYAGSFSLRATYDDSLRAASGLFTGPDTRLFLDPPGA